MKQLTQQLKSGKMEILEVPFPVLGEKQILVRNHYSVISTGTEGKTVSDARKGYIAKAKSRQKEVKQVIDMIKTQGLRSTYDFVMNKLDAPSALGYSCAGEVIAVGSEVNNFQIGDWAACGGNSASHADVVAVPVHLAVKIPKHVPLKEAAFTTLGAIALQGIRQSDLKVGENCLIIGMGLIGQLTAKILEASGIQVLGVDVDEQVLAYAQQTGIKQVYPRNAAGLEDLIEEFSGGFGVDAVIITAATSSLDPINFAGKVCRNKGKIIIVGAVPTGFDREAYYKKELELRMSKSYGPGRGDLNYEEKAIDYPLAHVRWTENRNMEAFVSLLANGKINMASLISHTFTLENAPEAYNLVMAPEKKFNGIVIEYEKLEPKSELVLRTRTAKTGNKIGLIGAGKFAQGTLLPQMKSLFTFGGLVTPKGNISKYVADKYDFDYATAETERLFKDPAIDLVVVTTRHDSHASYVLKAIAAQKHVFVEKPLALSREELEQIKTAQEEAQKQGVAKQILVGFNRRFAPATLEVLKYCAPEQAKGIQIRVNAGEIPLEHWINDPEIGGGRIIGEACHFVDLAQFLAGSPIESVSANALEKANGLVNSVSVSLSFMNGSIASISYFSNGNKDCSKEFIEVFVGGTVIQIDDFKEVKIFGQGKKHLRFKNRDKGHARQFELIRDSLVNGGANPLPFASSYLSTLATFSILQSIRENRKITL